MKVSRNTAANVVHSSSYKSNPKPPKPNSSSASSRPSKSSSSSVNNVSPKPAKSSGASPSKTGQSGNVQPKTLKPSPAASKDTKTSTVQSKPVKQGTGPVPQNTAKTVTKHLPGHHMEKTGTNSQVSKKDNKASETVVLKKTVSKRDSATSKAIEVKNVASKKDSSTSKAVETKKVTTGKVDNRSYVKDVSVTKSANVVKTGRMVSVIGGYNSKKDNNTDKRKKADNKQSAGSIWRGDYNSAKITQNNGITARVLANKSGISQTLNGSAITVPKEFIPKGKKSDGILQTIGYLLNDAGKAGKELLSYMVKMALEQGDKLAKTVSSPEFRENTHNVFSTIGLFFPPGDVADIVLYLAEKNNKEALMSLAAVFPVGDAIKVAKNGVKFIGKQGEKLAVKAVKSESKVLKGEAKKVIKTKSKETAKIINKNLKANKLKLNMKMLHKADRVQIDKKLDFLFGKATGRAHNIHRTKSMQISLQKIGLHDNKVGREALIEHLEKICNDPTNIIEIKNNIFTFGELPNKPIGSYISVTRESFLMGPGGGVRLESVWKGNELLSVIIKEGKKHNGK